MTYETRKACPECGWDAYLDSEGLFYECSNEECLYAWEATKLIFMRLKNSYRESERGR